jgi:hypothetical protein
MSVQKRKRELLRMAQAICPTADVLHSGHHLQIVIYGPEGSRKVFCASTASDHRDVKNIKRDIMAAARATGLIADNRNTPAALQNRAR